MAPPTAVATKQLSIDFPPKGAISCELTAKDAKALREKPVLIFTHGSGGDLRAAAMTNFVSGFAGISPILCFKGNMNLSSRTKMFQRVCEYQCFSNCLGGRSMGARAAVMAATKDTTHLILASYPLHTEKDVRDEILLDIPPKLKVIFITGDKDAMCELERLEEVRRNMKCKTWLVRVKGADHGMNMKPKSTNATTSMGVATGKIVARWLAGLDDEEGTREATLSWHREEEQVQWCGWEIGETGIGSAHRMEARHPSSKAETPTTAMSIEDDKKEDYSNHETKTPEPSRKRRNRSEQSASKRSKTRRD